MSVNHFKDPFKSLREPKNLVLVAMLMSLAVVTSFLNVQLTQALRLSFSFLFIALIAVKFGPFIAGAAGGIVDVIQFLVKPTGPYQPLLTLTAVLTGVIYGLFLYRNRRSMFLYRDRQGLWRVILSHTVVTLLVSTLMNSYFISILYGKLFREFLVTRAIKNAIMFVPELLLLFAVIGIYYRLENQVFKKSAAQNRDPKAEDLPDKPE